jgi:DNA-binding GntR family transcriptional regulator
MAERIIWRSRSRLVDEVAEELRERIYDGTYDLGTKLHQEQLASDLNVSRTPLREALRILESEGLLSSEPGKGVRVASADAATLLAAYQVRDVVDGLAARLAARSSDERARAALGRIVVDQERALAQEDVPAYVHDNVRFHTAIIDLSGNRYLLTQVPIVRMTSQVFRPRGVISPVHAHRAIAQHRDIAAAILAGDEKAAEAAARKHIKTTTDGIADAIRD